MMHLALLGPMQGRLAVCLLHLSSMGLLSPLPEKEQDVTDLSWGWGGKEA